MALLARPYSTGLVNDCGYRCTTHLAREIAHACNEGLGVPVMPACKSTRRAILLL